MSLGRGSAATGLVLVLLVATAVAFVTTERRKLERNPIVGLQFERVVSPVCRCDHRVARLTFGVRKTEVVTVDLEDAEGRAVRTLVDGRRVRPGGSKDVEVAWDGRDDRGRVLPDGGYDPQIHLGSVGRTFTLPASIVVDTRAPRMTLLGLNRRTLGRGRRLLRASYLVSEPAHGLLFVAGRRRVRSRGARLRGTLEWYGRAGGRPLPPGRYGVRLAAVDLAGNVGSKTPPQTIRIR